MVFAAPSSPWAAVAAGTMAVILPSLSNLQIRQRVQLGVDEAAEHHGNEGQHEDADPVHQGAHETAGFLRRWGRSVVGCIGHGSIS